MSLNVTQISIECYKECCKETPLPHNSGVPHFCNLSDFLRSGQNWTYILPVMIIFGVPVYSCSLSGVQYLLLMPHNLQCIQKQLLLSLTQDTYSRCEGYSLKQSPLLKEPVEMHCSVSWFNPSSSSSKPLSTTPYGLGYPSGQLGTAVPIPSSLDTPSPLTGRVG